MAAIYCYMPSGSFHVGETGIFLDGCLFSVLISSLILSLALEDESRLTSGFKGKYILSLSSDLGTDAFECRLGFSEALTSMILEDIFAL